MDPQRRPARSPFFNAECAVVVHSRPTLAVMKKLATSLLVLLFGSSGASTAKESETKTFQTQEGPVTATSTTVEAVPQGILLASAKHVAEISALSFKANVFARTYLPGVSNPSLKDLDDAFLLWQREMKRPYTEQQVIEMLGAHLGSRLVAELDMEWVVVTDQYGTDFAVRARKYEVVSFPFSSVAKRIERGQYEFMAGVYRTVQHTIASGDLKAR
jgi:hypothetical protein